MLPSSARPKCDVHPHTFGFLNHGPRVPRTGGKRHNTARASLAVMGNGGKSLAARGTYSLPEELARHASRKWFASDQLRGACREAGERSEEHTSELQSHSDLVCRLLLEKKKR